MNTINYLVLQFRKGFIIACRIYLLLRFIQLNSISLAKESEFLNLDDKTNPQRLILL